MKLDVDKMVARRTLLKQMGVWICAYLVGEVRTGCPQKTNPSVSHRGRVQGQPPAVVGIMGSWVGGSPWNRLRNKKRAAEPQVDTHQRKGGGGVDAEDCQLG